MKSLVSWSKDIWKKIKQGPAKLPSLIEIPEKRVDLEKDKLPLLTADNYYFEIYINEMYLPYGRNWFSTYYPMVSVVSEFQYGKEIEAIPNIVGNTKFNELSKKKKIPEKMIFENISVSGPHPYRGGQVTLSLVLWRVKQKDYTGTIMKLVEHAAEAFLPCSITKVSGVVLEGLDNLLQGDDVTPLLGIRKGFGSQKEGLQSGYYVLIDNPGDDFDETALHVRDDHLHMNGKPYQKSAFILFSIKGDPDRTDEERFSFYSFWELVQEYANSSMASDWKVAKSIMGHLYTKMNFSPDLTETHAEILSEKWTARMVEIHNKAVLRSKLGAEDEAPEKLKTVQKRVREILKMR
ncbi:MAG: hypothetical protein ACXABD_12890 [Candidatus Thorarchaeota archaeon]